MRVSYAVGARGIHSALPISASPHSPQIHLRERCRTAASYIAAASSQGGAQSKQSGKASKSKSRKSSNGTDGKPQSQGLTGALQVQTLEQLTSVETQPVPLWDSFCGAIGGYWQGSMAAFHPDTGKPEEVALSSDGRKLFDMQTILVADRMEDGGVQRRFQMAETKEEIKLTEGDSVSGDELWDTDMIEEDEAGLAVFDGGSYSRGPLRLGVVGSSAGSPRTSSDASNMTAADGITSSTKDQQTTGKSTTNGSRGLDAHQSSTLGRSNDVSDAQDSLQTDDSEEVIAEEPEPLQTVVIEQCVAWGGELRIRMQITLAIAELWEGEEMDVEILRVVVFREAWECLSDDAACSLEDMISPLSSSPLIPKDQVIGEYKVFDLSAVPVEDTDPFTGETKQLLLHYSQETQQAWNAPAAAAEDGAALWLPGKLLLQLRMMPAGTSSGLCSDEEVHVTLGNTVQASRGKEADASEGVDLAAPRGLLLSAGWAASDGVMSLVEREYDGSGFLSEVRARTAVRGGWVGGRM